jgi:hypothetical protein
MCTLACAVYVGGILLHASTVTSRRRARYAGEDLCRYVDEEAIGQGWSGSNRPATLAAYVFIYVCKCQVNADATVRIYIAYGNARACQVHGRVRGKNTLSRLS